jgi:hypothetical protein
LYNKVTLLLTSTNGFCDLSQLVLLSVDLRFSDFKKLSFPLSGAEFGSSVIERPVLQFKEEVTGHLQWFSGFLPRILFNVITAKLFAVSSANATTKWHSERTEAGAVRRG